jgi:uncharacterized membrane protein
MSAPAFLQPVRDVAYKIVTDLEHASLRQLVMWEKPYAAGAIVATVVSTVFFFSWLDYTLLTLLCRLIQVSMAVLGLSRYIGYLSPSFDFSTFVNNAIEQSKPKIINIASELYKILCWHDQALSLSVLLAATVIAMLGEYLPFTWVLLLATALAFTLPIYYTKNQKVIDGYVSQAKTTVGNLLSQVPAANLLKKSQ